MTDEQALPELDTRPLAESPSGPATHTLMRTLIESVMTGVLSQGFLVVSGVVMARMLSVHDRGAVAFVTVIPTILVQICTLGVPRAVTYESARPGGWAGSALRTAFPLAIIQTASVVVVGCGAALLLVDEPDERGLALAALTYAPFGVLLVYGLAALQGLHEFRAFNVLRLSPGASYAGYVAVLAVLGRPSASLAVAGWVGTTAVVSVVLAVHVRSKLATKQPDPPDAATATWRSLLSFGSRSLVGSLSPLGGMNADQVIVGVILSPAVLGLYVIASAICNLPRFVAQSLGMVAYPHVARLARRARARAVLRLALVTCLMMGVVVAGLELLMGFIIPFFFGDAYIDSVPIARMLVLSAFFFGMSRVLSDSLQGAGHPVDGTIAEGAAWLALGIVLLVTWNRLDGTGFAAAMTLAAAASCATVTGLAFIRLASRSRSSTLGVETTP